MFERFTDRARQSILESQAEAIEQEHDFIGTEHLLLGLLRIGSGVAFEALTGEGADTTVVREKVIAHLAEIVDPARAAVSKSDALAAIGIDLGSVKASMEAAFGPGALPDLGSTPRYTPLAKSALTGSLRHALILRNRYIGTEHLLLGLLDQPETVACAALRDIGIDLEGLASRVVERVAPAEARLERVRGEISRLQVEASQLPAEAQAAGAAVLRQLSEAQGRAWSTEQIEVVRVADGAAATLEDALARARAELSALANPVP